MPYPNASIRVHADNKSVYVNVFSSIIFALLFVNIDLILGIEYLSIKDRVNYLKYPSSIDALINRLFYDEINILLSEPLFLFSIYGLSKIGLTPTNVINTVIFVSSFVASFTLLQKGQVKPLWVMVALLLPWFSANYIMTIGQGLGVSLFLIGWFFLSGKTRIIIVLLTPLIHYGFYVLLAIMSLTSVVQTLKISPRLSAITSIFIGFIVGYFILDITDIVSAETLTDRYQDKHGMLNVGFGTIFWLAIFFLFVIQSKWFVKEYMFAIIAIGICVGAGLFFPPFSRIIQNIAVFVLIAGFALRGWSIMAFKTLILAVATYGILIYLYTDQFWRMLNV